MNFRSVLLNLKRTIEDTIHSDEHRLFFNEGQKVSLLKRILGDWRLPLGTETISKLMHVCSDAPPPHEYDSQLAITPVG